MAGSTLAQLAYALATIKSYLPARAAFGLT